MEIKGIRKENHEFREEIGILRQENEIAKKKLEQTRQKVASLERIIDYHEKERKKDNIIMKGLKTDMDKRDIC